MEQGIILADALREPQGGKFLSPEDGVCTHAKTVLKLLLFM